MSVGWLRVHKLWFSSDKAVAGPMVVGAVLALWVGADIGAAATVVEAEAPAGQPVHQQFLASGASIMTTADSRTCVVSQRIGIETSIYLEADGTRIPFAQVTRSIAASVQAVAATGGTGFRVQLKYSPAPGTPILLALADREIDLQGMLEPSTDSLWITGEVAAAVAAAFAGTEPVGLTALSADTGRQVTDVLAAPDLVALQACATDLAVAGPAGPLTNEIRISFDADPVTTPLATLPELTACGMTDVPGELHLARLETVTGFYAQTDKVFVSFDDAGAVAQVYIPGILDGDFRGDANIVRLSLAADSNVPMQENTVKGCLGAKTVTVCHYGLADGAQLLAACVGLPGSGDGSDYGQPPGETLVSLFSPGSGTPGSSTPDSGTPGSGTPGSGGGTPGVFTPGPDTGGPDGTIDGELPGDPDGPDPEPPEPPGPSPVPLPAAAWLLIAALLGLAAVPVLRRA